MARTHLIYYHSKTLKVKVPYSIRCSDRIQCVCLFSISFYYYAYISLIICPGLEDGMFVSIIQSYYIDQICDPAVICAWSLKYHGNTHKFWLKAINDLHMLPIQHNYAKIIAIDQSFGSGKSKTVDKVAMEQILFPICLCEDIFLVCSMNPE